MNQRAALIERLARQLKVGYQVGSDWCLWPEEIRVLTQFADELAALLGEPAAQDWLPMETAPVNIDVLITVAGLVGEARLHDDDSHDDGWWWANTYGEHHAEKIENRHGQPEHWMPLPAPPTIHESRSPDGDGQAGMTSKSVERKSDDAAPQSLSQRERRCGGTGMVACWDGSSYTGEMCRGCIDCKPPCQPIATTRPIAEGEQSNQRLQRTNDLLDDLLGADQAEKDALHAQIAALTAERDRERGLRETNWRYQEDVIARLTAELADREGLPYARILELLAEHDITDTDVLKHRLEDHARWEEDLRAGRMMLIVERP